MGSAEARRILAKYPDSIPVICEREAQSSLPAIPKRKFLVPCKMLCEEFRYVIRKHINQCADADLGADQAIYLSVNTLAPKTGMQMSQVYAEHKAEDDFLYMTYRADSALWNKRCA